MFRTMEYRGIVSRTMREKFPGHLRILKNAETGAIVVEYPSTGMIRNDGREVPGNVYEVHQHQKTGPGRTTLMPVGEYFTRRRAKKAAGRAWAETPSRSAAHRADAGRKC